MWSSSGNHNSFTVRVGFWRNHMKQNRKSRLCVVHSLYYSTFSLQRVLGPGSGSSPREQFQSSPTSLLAKTEMRPTKTKGLPFPFPKKLKGPKEEPWSRTNLLLDVLVLVHRDRLADVYSDVMMQLLSFGKIMVWTSISPGLEPAQTGNILVGKV